MFWVWLLGLTTKLTCAILKTGSLQWKSYVVSLVKKMSRNSIRQWVTDSFEARLLVSWQSSKIATLSRLVLTSNYCSWFGTRLPRALNHLFAVRAGSSARRFHRLRLQHDTGKATSNDKCACEMKQGAYQFPWTLDNNLQPPPLPPALLSKPHRTADWMRKWRPFQDNIIPLLPSYPFQPIFPCRPFIQIPLGNRLRDSKRTVRHCEGCGQVDGLAVSCAVASAVNQKRLIFNFWVFPPKHIFLAKPINVSCPMKGSFYTKMSYTDVSSLRMTPPVSPT